MGRLTTFLTILIMIDLVFILTGQICVGNQMCSISSVIFGTITHPSWTVFSDWIHQFVGNLGNLFKGDTTDNGFIANLISLLAAAGVVVGSAIIGLKNESVLWAPAGLVLAALVADFLNIYSYLASYNQVVATLIFSPIAIIYVFTCVEWVRGMA